MPLTVMAGESSSFLFLFLLSLPIFCSNGAPVDLSDNAKRLSDTITIDRPWTTLKLNRVSLPHIHVFGAENVAENCLQESHVSVDLFLNEDQARNLANNDPSALFQLKAEILTSLHNRRIKSIIVGHENRNLSHGEAHELLCTLESIHKVLSSFCYENKVKLSLAFSLPQLEKLCREHARYLPRMLNFLHKTRISLVVIEKSIERESGILDQLVGTTIERAISVTSFFPWQDFQMVWTIKGLNIHTAAEKGRFSNKLYNHLGADPKVRSQIADLFIEGSFSGENRKIKKKGGFPHRELLSKLRTTEGDGTQTPPAINPLTPITTTPTPDVVTVPANTPIPVNANTPTPIPIPSTTTPIVPPPINPATTPVPITNPAATPITNPATTPITVPGAQPVTNPVTTYPSPQGNVPLTPVTSPTPVTNPVAPPTSVTNAPAIPGQSWCIAKSGVPETALQEALDYACGIGGADCSQIQQGASCYNPNSVQNHASYAFNSYYQKNPVPTSCDFGGTAAIVNTNPSTGSCVFPSSSSSSTPATSTPTTPPTMPTTPTTPPTMPTTPTTPPTMPTTPPTMPTTPAPTTASSSSSSNTTPVSGSGTPPVSNVSNPAASIPTGYGTTTPPAMTDSASISANFQPRIGCMVLLTTLVTARLMNT